jgi:3-hydroxyacyl-CoA dehydrogenase
MTGTDAGDVSRVAVVGAGLMGHGIALSFALGGRSVALYDVDPDVLAEAEGSIRSAHATVARHRDVADAATVLDRIAFETDLDAAVGDAEFVTEAVVERMDVKREVFERLDEHTDDAVLATNTSGLSITDLCDVVADGSRVVGTHWFNPPYVVPLVEVVRGEGTGDCTVEATRALLEDVGKTAVVVQKDIPGFIGNRIQMAMAYEAFSLLDRGVASAEDIDRAVRAGFGFRLPVLGIFEKVDQSGLDVQYEVESYLMEQLDRGTEPNPVVERLVEEGNLGLKTGKGVYDWSGTDPAAVSERRDDALLSLLDVYADYRPGYEAGVGNGDGDGDGD